MIFAIKYVTLFIISLFSITFGGLGFYIGCLLGAIVEYALDNETYIVNNSSAVYISYANLIIVDMDVANENNYSYFLTHELIHKYQELQIVKDRFDLNDSFHEGLSEGNANAITNKLTRIHLIEPVNHDIPFANLVTEDDLSKSIDKYGATKVMEQCTFYAEEYLKMYKKLYLRIARK